MFKFLRFAKREDSGKADLLNADTAKADPMNAVSVKEIEDAGELGIVCDLLKKINSRDLTASSPEEIKEIARVYTDRIFAYRKARDKEFLDNVFAILRRERNEGQSTPPDESVHSAVSPVPFRSRQDVKREIRELADHIKFD